eukprot:364999-Chlamydomonas_euryale.AAC.26
MSSRWCGTCGVGRQGACAIVFHRHAHENSRACMRHGSMSRARSLPLPSAILFRGQGRIGTCRATTRQVLITGMSGVQRA